jgi:flagellar biosynthesis/type III secretory pathway protein FliH
MFNYSEIPNNSKTNNMEQQRENLIAKAHDKITRTKGREYDPNALEIQKEINKLAEEVYGKGVKEDYEEGYVDGYNKAKETLYTKEQLMGVIELARLIDYNGSNDYYMSEDEIIKALKP